MTFLSNQLGNNLHAYCKGECTNFTESGVANGQQMHKYKRLKREAYVGVGNPIRNSSHFNVLLAFYFILSKLGIIGFFQGFLDV